MMKKGMSLLLALMLLLSLLAGCAKTPAAGSPTPAVSPAAESPAPENTPAIGEGVAAPEAAVAQKQVYVTPAWVQSVIDGAQPQSKNYVVLEGSWGYPTVEYLQGHITGAVHMNTDLVESPEYWNIRTPEEITKLMQDYGITKDTVVIVYGNDSGAARIAFVCLWAGVEEVHMVDGGFKAWQAAGLPTQAGEEKPTPADSFGAEIPVHPEYVLSMPADVVAAQKDPAFRLVSIRSWDEFIGKVSGYSYIERTGEPAGAVWGHDEADYYREDGTVKSIDDLQVMWKEWDVTKENTISFYCGTGWRATVPFLICYQNGWENVTLYDGGWFVWQMYETLPVQTGDPR